MAVDSCVDGENTTLAMNDHMRDKYCMVSGRKLSNNSSPSISLERPSPRDAKRVRQLDLAVSLAVKVGGGFGDLFGGGFGSGDGFGDKFGGRLMSLL